MISNINEIDIHLKKKIIYEYEVLNNSVTNIAKMFKLDRNVVLAVLIDKVSTSDLPNGYINQDKFISIADTHLGSVYEMFSFLDEVYNFAYKKGIKTILHAGDLMQSTMFHVKNNYVNEEKQLMHIVNEYPYDESINNKILFGNHDFHTLAKKDEYMHILKSRRDFHILGFKKAYLSWCNYLIAVSHDIKKYKITIPNVATFLRIVGHRHALIVNGNNNITVPSLSLDTKKYANAIRDPGFLLIEKDNNMCIVSHYIFKNMLLSKNSEEEINDLKKRNKIIENKGVVLTHKLRDCMKVK